MSTFMMLRNLASGGSHWEVTRRVGDGQSSRPRDELVGTVMGFAFQTQPRGVSASGQGFVTQTTWSFMAAPESDIRKGDKIQSVRVPTMKFQITAVDPEQGYLQAVIEELP
jgi:hypothetical protein